jgi:TonB family protein
MIIPWIIYAIVFSALISISALLFDHAARALRLPARHIWLVAIFGCLAGPAAALLLPLSTASTAAEPATLLPFSSSIQSISRAAEHAIPELWMRGANTAAIVLWLLATAAISWRIARNSSRMRDLTSTWRRRHVDGTLVRIAPEAGPAVVGTSDVEMEIVIPEWLLAFDRSLRALILRHEDEHRRAHDPLMLMVAAAAGALVPWNPAVHWLRRRLALAVEMDCDSRVLRVHPDVDRYAKLLLAAAQLRSIPRATAALMLTDDTSHLERRIVAMKKFELRRNGLAAGCAILAAALVVIVACDVKDPARLEAPGRVDEQLAAKAAEASALRNAAQGEPYFSHQVEKMAAMLPGNREPRYPAKLRGRRIQGKVLIGFVVTEDGRVAEGSATVIESTHPAFAESALEALKDYRLRPAEVGGRKVRVHVRLPFDFALVGGK